MLAVLAAHRCALVRRLVIGKVGEVREQTPQMWGYVQTWHAHLAPIWPAVPRVRHLVLRGDPGPLGGLALPELERLELVASRLPPAATRTIANAACPRLARLDIRYKWESYSLDGSATLTDEIAPLLASELALRLVHLSLTGFVRADRLCRYLASLHRPALRELDLSGGDLTDAGAEDLAASGLRLEILDVTRNRGRLTARGIAALDRIAKLVITDHHR